jgi:hypothetical protein
MQKTIYFFKLDIKKILRHEYYPENLYFNIFDTRFNLGDIKTNKDPIWDNYASCRIDNNLIVDILEHQSTHLFGTIGCTKNENRLRRIRNTTNLAHIDFQLDPNTILEDYTFFYMDYLTGIISVLNSKGAPDIKTLKRLLFNDPEMEPDIYPIQNRNVSRALDRIEEVGGIELRFAVPPDELLGDNGMCASMQIINQFKNDGFERCELRLYMDRNNPKRKQPKEIIKHVKETYELVKDSYNNKVYKLEKLGLLATPEDDRQQPINVLELYFTKGVNIKIDEDFSEERIKDALFVVYNNMKEEILQNVGLHFDR